MHENSTAKAPDVLWRGREDILAELQNKNKQGATGTHPISEENEFSPPPYCNRFNLEKYRARVREKVLSQCYDEIDKQL